MKQYLYYAINILGLLIIFGEIGFTQILNVERVREKNDSLRHLATNINFRLRLNNRTAAADDPRNFFSTNLQANFAYFTPNHHYLCLNHFDYFASNGRSLLSIGYHHLRVNLMRQQRLSYELFAQAQYEPPRGLRERFLAGAGLRLRFWESEKTAFFAGTGLMIEQELWQDPSNETINRQVEIWKSSNYLSFRWKSSKNLRFDIIAYYQTGYDAEASVFRHRLNADANLNFEISKHLDFQVSFSGAYENRPIVPITRFVYSLSNGLRLRI